MEILQIALKDVKILLKDVKALLFIVLMPIIIICVLGVSLNSIFEKDTANIQQCEIALVDKDNSDATKSIKNFFETKDVKKYIKIVDVKEEDAKKKVKAGDLTALIVIPEQYSEKVTNMENVKISFYADNGSPIEGSIVKSILERYINSSNIMLAASDAVKPAYTEYKLDAGMILKDIEALIEEQEKIVKDGDFGSSNDTLSAMQYYSAAMVSMYILFVGMFGTTSLLEEKEKGTFRRLLITNVGRSKILAGKVLGNFILGILDTTILIFFTKFVYKVDWGNSLLGVILLTMTMAFAVSGFAIFIATLFKSSKTVDIVNPMLILIISFIGGNMYPLYEMSELLRKFSMLLMNNWALRGYLNLMINNGVRSVFAPCLVLIGMGVMFLTAGVAKLKVE